MNPPPATAATRFAARLMSWQEEAEQDLLDHIDRYARAEKMDDAEIEALLKAQGEPDLAVAWLEYCEDNG